MAKSGKKLLGLTTLSFSLKEARIAVPQSVILKANSDFQKKCEFPNQNNTNKENETIKTIKPKNSKYK